MASSSHVIMDDFINACSRRVCLWMFIQGNAGDAGIPGAAGLKVRASCFVD